MILYRCKAIRHLEESIHKKLPENMVRSLRNPNAECFTAWSPRDRSGKGRHSQTFREACPNGIMRSLGKGC